MTLWSHEQDRRFVTAAAPHLSDCDKSNEEDDDELTKMVKQDMMEGGGRARRTRGRDDNKLGSATGTATCVYV